MKEIRTKVIFLIQLKLQSVIQLKYPKIGLETKDNIYISLYPNDDENKDFLHTKITDEFVKVYVHSDSGKLQWISLDDIKKWNISLADLDKQANLNADKLLEETKITFDKIDNKKLGLIEVEQTSLKGALLLHRQ